MMATHATRRLPGVAVPDELLGVVPRQVRLTGGGLAVAVMAVAMAIASVVSAILLSIAYDRDGRERQLRARDAVTAQAQIIQVRLQHGDHPRRIVTYLYEVNGRRYTGRTTLRQRDRRDVREGSAESIWYLASRPATSWMAGYEPGGFPVLLIPLISISLLLGAAGLAWIVRRQWILLSEGRVAQARVTGHTKVQHGEHRALRVSYEFRTLSGATRTGSYEVRKNPPPEGTFLPIVYHRDNPGRSARYPLQLVRPERGRRLVR